MKKFLIVLSALVLMPAGAVFAQIYSFERSQETAAWRSEGAELSYSTAHWKLGRRSLRIDWRPGAVVRIDDARGLLRASESRNGGIALWVYNERPDSGALRLRFLETPGGAVCCGMEIRLGFSGWRCVWNKFVEDMGKAPQSRISCVEIRFPETGPGGTLCLDALEFTPTVSWQKMSDFQVRVRRTDFSLIPDFMKYRLAEPDPARRVSASPEQIAVIAERLDRWYLGTGSPTGDWVERRRRHESEFIRRGVSLCAGYSMTEPLYPLRTPAEIEGEKTRYFMDINKRILLPLALDYRRNGNAGSRDRALRIYDWFSEQGWADGSSLGTLCFEKLRSAGYFHSLYLLRDELPAAVRERELSTLRWMTLFGICCLDPAHPGEVADNLRALALPKLIYALMQPEGVAQQTALTAFRDYMDSALDFGPGYFGTFKSDGSGYHHRGPYDSAYYPHALYVGALVAYLLHDTPYALSAESLAHLKQGLLTFRFFCAELTVPAGTSGRFPLGREVLQELLPAFAYVAYSCGEPDTELLAAARRLMDRNPEALNRLMDRVDSDLSYTSTVGEAELLTQARQSGVAAEPAPEGSLFMPYSGRLTVRRGDFHFNVKGFSRYIWDFESSDTENLSGRYLSNGALELTDLKSGAGSFNPQFATFDWSLIPGTTSILLPDDLLREKRHRKGYSDHRNYSDETFLAGVSTADRALFSFRLHAPAYEGDLRADKSYFFLGDAVLCLGSGISATDTEHPTVTTLFQSCGKGAAGKVRRVSGGSIVADPAGVVYAVAQGDVRTDRDTVFTRGWLDHGNAPCGASYAYYLIPERGTGLARQLLRADGPVEIVRQDTAAHIVRERADGRLFAALYDASATFPGLLVKRVNIPLAYILEPAGADSYRLTLCEPDMRRPSVNCMDQLTEAQVVVPERAFATRLVLRGLYEVGCPDGTVQVSRTSDETVVELSTICGRNYELRLRALR